MRERGILILVFLLLIAEGRISAYPSVSDAVCQIQSASSIRGYQRQVKETGETTMNAMITETETFSKTLSDTLPTSPFQTDAVGPCLDDIEYDSLLSVSGLIGYINIPVIDVYLSVHYGTLTATPEKDADHLCDLALPIGGEGTHGVILTYRGPPSAKVSTDLGQVQMEDMSCFRMPDRIPACQTNKIEMAEPTELSSLNPVPGEGYMTLFTCTPYGINSHWLLVRGVGIPYEVTTVKETAKNADGDASKLNMAVSPTTMMTVVGAGIAVLTTFVALTLLAVTVVTRTWKRHKRRRKGRQK